MIGFYLKRKTRSLIREFQNDRFKGYPGYPLNRSCTSLIDDIVNCDFEGVDKFA